RAGSCVSPQVFSRTFAFFPCLPLRQSLFICCDQLFGKDMDNTPQFDVAKYPGSSTGEVCKLCQQPLGGVYYRANTSLLCGSCAEKLQRQVPQDNHAAFVRAILFGLGGFVLGLALYAGFTILTGIEIGFVSLAVGWLVGKAMMMGSQGAGGRRDQIG